MHPGAGKHYSLNVPLQDGMTDEAYVSSHPSTSSPAPPFPATPPLPAFASSRPFQPARFFFQDFVSHFSQIRHRVCVVVSIRTLPHSLFLSLSQHQTPVIFFTRLAATSPSSPKSWRCSAPVQSSCNVAPTPCACILSLRLDPPSLLSPPHALLQPPHLVFPRATISLPSPMTLTPLADTATVSGSSICHSEGTDAACSS
jgi:hypothetical protein